MSPVAAPNDSERPATEGGSGPRHVAIIMDGNGRWAKKRGLPRVAGHRAGAEAVRRTLRAAVKYGVEVLTLYAFSSENWRRTEEEVSDLKGLLGFYLERELDSLAKEGVRLRLIGDYRKFGPDLSARLERAMERLKDNERLTLVVALNYGSRSELAEAARNLAIKAQAGEIDPRAIDEQCIEQELDTNGLPELDLLIRTSGEVRLSNFLLWQAAYAELMFTPVLWPDFGEAELQSAIEQFASRERRFGGR
ncbi:MAG: isoprenyl transferase [Sphingomonas sp.]|nr:isoprenyl transferase [Sphingomonas sp.]